MCNLIMINSKGITLIKTFEGLKLQPYICPAGKPTIGYGTTVYPSGKKVKMTDPAITESIATKFLMHDISNAENHIIKLVTKPLTANQFSALVSFVYNVGTFNFKRSTLLKKVNINPDDVTIRNEFMKWVKITDPKTGWKVVTKGLVRRRQAESELYYLT